MKISEFCKLHEDKLTVLSCAEPEAEIKGGYVGDLLSWVMGRGVAGQMWVTIMTNINVLAVASLIEFSAVVIAENAEVSADIITAAETRGINLIKTPLTSFEFCKLIADV